MADETKRIKKIKLNDGQVYSIFDNGALRLSDDNKLITGNEVVDQVIFNNNLYITEIDDVAVADYSNLLVIKADGKVGAVSKDRLLSDIGGVSRFNLDNGVLSLKIGKDA